MRVPQLAGGRRLGWRHGIGEAAQEKERRVSCTSESELLPSLLSHLQVSAIEPEPPRSFLSRSCSGFDVRVNLATWCRPCSRTGLTIGPGMRSSRARLSCGPWGCPVRNPHDYTADDMTEVLLTNVVGYLRLFHAFLPLLEKSDDPRIVNVRTTGPPVPALRHAHPLRGAAGPGHLLVPVLPARRRTRWICLTRVHLAELRARPSRRSRAIWPGALRADRHPGWPARCAAAGRRRRPPPASGGTARRRRASARRCAGGGCEDPGAG
jgi:hypothetical protein